MGAAWDRRPAARLTPLARPMSSGVELGSSGVERDGTQRSVRDGQDLLAPRPDPDAPDRTPREVLEGAHVGLRAGRKGVEGAAGGDVLPPAVEVLIHRTRVVE